MDPQKEATTVSIEKELTCSICTDILYQPLTLLDCLHTYCGSCLKEWFDHVATRARFAPSAPPPGSSIFTCPGCRSVVRDTGHNATVFTLLEMYLAANPDKARSESEKKQIAENYKPGDAVIPVLYPDGRPLRSHDAPEGLGDVGASSAASRSSWDRGRERPARPPGHSVQPAASSGDDRAGTREQRRRRHGESRTTDGREQRRIEPQASLRTLIWESGLSEHEIEHEISELVRQIEADGLLDDVDLDSVDLNRNEALMQTITEVYRRRRLERDLRDERSLEPDREQVRPRIMSHSSDSYSPQPPAPASTLSTGHVVSTGAVAPVFGPLPVTQTNLRPRSHRYARSASASQTHPRSMDSSTDDVLGSRLLLPPGAEAGGPSQHHHTGVPTTQERRRRQSITTCTAQNSASGIRPPQQHQSVAGSEIMGLSHSDASAARGKPGSDGRPVLAIGDRSSSLPAGQAMSLQPSPLPETPLSPNGFLSFASRALGASTTVPAECLAGQQPPAVQDQNRRQYRSVGLDAVAEPVVAWSKTALRTRCRGCDRDAIELELHYSCRWCDGGKWNLCSNCYRNGKGCRGWKGFRQAARARWQYERAQGQNEPEAGRQLARLGARGSLGPNTAHFLTAIRYVAPDLEGGLEGKQQIQIEKGNFCAVCLAWANNCWWRCDVCNQGDWGFCHSCVCQGRSCTHPLLPITYFGAVTAGTTGSGPGLNTSTSRVTVAEFVTPSPPLWSSVMDTDLGAEATETGTGTGTGTGVGVGVGLGLGLGQCKRLSFHTACASCEDSIAPNQARYHCFSCANAQVAGSWAGEYEICTSCYNWMEEIGLIGPENGAAGWLRCPIKGHRMEEYAFTDGPEGEYRMVLREPVGGHQLLLVPRLGKAVASSIERETWSWIGEDGLRRERLVVAASHDLASSAVIGQSRLDGSFPPAGGTGGRAVAKWGWWRDGTDMLHFPRGAEISELEDVNGDWWFGVYHRHGGLFPSAFVELRSGAAIRVLDDRPAGAKVEADADMRDRA